jgi:carbamoyl-phosphate synthase small subunit
MKATLILEDGTAFEGTHFGAPFSAAGEVVFNTGMVGYPESMTDPSYSGQILALTYPLVGNYGIPVDGASALGGPDDLSEHFESNRIHVKGLVVSVLSGDYSHWSALDSLNGWMTRNGVPGIAGIDTRALTKRLRTKGCMLGKILVSNEEIAWDDPNQRNLVAEVSVTEPVMYRGGGAGRVALVDLGTKHNIIRSLLRRKLEVLRVPWNHDWSNEDVEGVVLSNGPGDPKMCVDTVRVIRKAMERNLPIFGICLGSQLLALAAGGDTYKLKFGHRGQNQPCIEVGSRRCYITSQNHGYAVNEQTLGDDWVPWFFNANDGTNEGIRHRSKPFSSVQFHPEARPGPVDTAPLFDRFIQTMRHGIRTP